MHSQVDQCTYVAPGALMLYVTKKVDHHHAPTYLEKNPPNDGVVPMPVTAAALLLLLSRRDCHSLLE